MSIMANIFFKRGTNANRQAQSSQSDYNDSIYFTKASSNAALDSIYVGGALVGTSKIENLLTVATSGSLFYSNGTGIATLTKGANGKFLKATVSGLEWSDTPAAPEYTQGTTKSSTNGNVLLKLFKDGVAVSDDIKILGDTSSCIEVTTDSSGDIRVACTWSSL